VLHNRNRRRSSGGNSWAAALLLLALASPAHASGPVGTPEKLIRELSAAAREGDVNGFLSYLTADARKAVQESAASQASLRVAEESFQKALDERFGKGEPILTSPPMDLKTAISRVDGFELLGKKPGPAGTMYLRVRTSIKTQQGKTSVREDTFVAGQENGSWKLDLNPGQSLNAKAEIAAVNRTTAALRNGEFRDRSSAMSGLRQARSLAAAGQLSKEHEVAFRQKSAPPPPKGATVSVPPLKQPPAQ